MSSSSRALAALLGLLLLAAQATAGEPSRLKGELDAKGLAEAIAREKGRVVLVNFWATWCVPCREEFPDLVKLESALRSKGLVVIGVSTDFGKDSSAVEKFLAAFHPGFPNYRKKSGGDDQDFIDAVDSRWGGELPYSILYGREGQKAEVMSGKQSYAEFERKVSRLLQ